MFDILTENETGELVLHSTMTETAFLLTFPKAKDIVEEMKEWGELYTVVNHSGKKWAAEHILDRHYCERLQRPQ